MTDRFRPDPALRRLGRPIPATPPSPAIYHSEVNKDRNRKDERP